MTSRTVPLPPVPRGLPRAVARSALQHTVRAPLPSPDLPVGTMLELPGRGRTHVVDVAGPDGAPTVVLLHALACTGRLSWYPVMSGLADHYRVVTLDQRWHGRGIRSPRFRLEDCADDVAAVADALGIDSFIPVGYSMGGLVAQLTWRRHRERVDGLVLGATARNFRGTRREKAFFPTMAAAMVPIGSYAGRRADRLAQGLPDPCAPSAPGGPGNWGMAEFRSTSAWSVAAVLAELGRFNSKAWIGEVDVPTAVIVTTKDRTIPARRQYRLAECIPGAVVHEVVGGHAALVTRAAAFESALHSALRSVTSAATPVAV